MSLLIAFWLPVPSLTSARAEGMSGGDPESYAGSNPYLFCRDRGGACDGSPGGGAESGSGEGGDGSGGVGGDGGSGNGGSAQVAVSSPCRGCGGALFPGGGLPGSGFPRVPLPDSDDDVLEPEGNGACSTCRSGDGEGETETSTGNDYTDDSGSVVDNSYFSYKHWADDIPAFDKTGLKLRRYHRTRDFFRSGSLGQSIVNTFDMRLRLAYEGEDIPTEEHHNVYNQEISFVDVPNSDVRLGFDQPPSNVSTLYPANRNRAEKLEIFDDQMSPVNGRTTHEEEEFSTINCYTGAKFAKLTTWDGSQGNRTLISLRSKDCVGTTLVKPLDGEWRT
jgi:hypothetical protein